MRKSSFAAFSFAATAALAQDFPPPDLSGNSPFWIRDPRSGCFAGNPFPAPGESIQWTGGCENGLLSGEGTLTWYAGRRIVARDVGTFVGGILSGHGRIMSVDGWSFEGEFPGTGVYTFPDGRQTPAQTLREPSGWRVEEIRQPAP